MHDTRGRLQQEDHFFPAVEKFPDKKSRCQALKKKFSRLQEQTMQKFSLIWDINDDSYIR